MTIHEPFHPGIIVGDALFDETDLTVTSASERLGVNRSTLSRLLNGRSGISPEMALRFSLLLNTSVEMWLNLQRDYDLWLLRKKKSKLKIKPLKNAA